LVIRGVLRAAPVLICQGTAWRQFFIQAGADPSRCVIVKNWIVAPELLALPLARRGPGALRVVYLGWIEREKGLFDLVAAIRKVVSAGRGVHLVIAGEGSAREALTDEIERLQLAPTVRFFGWADSAQRRELLRESDVLVMPSHSEGMPNALLEGMLAGRAVISTSVGAVPDVIRNGENGLLVSPRDVDGIANALIRIYDDPNLLEALAGFARHTARAEHDVDVAAQRLIAAVTGAER
jgi:glycosyltransferase involved in cell wall biosynthesis